MPATFRPDLAFIAKVLENFQQERKFANFLQKFFANFHRERERESSTVVASWVLLPMGLAGCRNPGSEHKLDAANGQPVQRQAAPASGCFVLK